MSHDYESERTASRPEAAAVLNGVVDGILAGSVQLGDGADAVVVDVPEELDLSLELESEDGDVELELELEWSVSDAGAAVSSPAGAPEDDERPEQPGAADGMQSLARFELFRDRNDEWRWRLRHRNGNVIATSGEGYTRKHNARKGLRSVVQNAPGAEVTDEFEG